MMTALFDYPKAAEYGRIVAKNKIFDRVRLSRKVQDLFAAQIKKIVWQYKLAPKTTNLAETDKVKEIEVFDIILKAKNFDTNLLRYIDKAVGHPVIFRLKFEGEVKIAATYKRPSDAEANKWVLSDTYFCTDWQLETDKKQSLPVVLNLSVLYEHLLSKIIPISAKDSEGIAEQIRRAEQVISREKEHKKLESRMMKEKQFNRKVELNSQLRLLDNEIKQLKG